MSTFFISLKNLWSKPLSTLLSLLLVLLGTAIISLLLIMGRQIEDQMLNNLKGVDMVVGAKGSPLQLILSAIYHIDAPTGNIPLPEANQLKKHPLIKSGIPLAYGDSYQGYRIIGSGKAYADLYDLEIDKGAYYTKDFEVVLGAKVAQRTGLKIGDQFVGTHGFDENGHEHGDSPYTVVGIAKSSNSVMDQLILCTIESVWAVHDHGEVVPDSLREYTAMLLSFRSPMANISLPRYVNSQTSMQAALPAIEINRLIQLMGFGIDTLQLLALIIIIVAGISIFIALYDRLKDRQYEIAVLRTLGIKRHQVLALILNEGVFMGMIGVALGLIVSRVVLLLLSQQIDANFNYNVNDLGLLKAEIWAAFGVVGLCLVAAVIPAVKALKIDVAETLTRN